MPSVVINPGTVVDGQGTGAITASNTTVNSLAQPILLAGDVVAPHGTHTGTITIDPETCSTSVFINGRGVAIEGSLSTCGGPVATTFNPTIQIETEPDA